MQDILIEIYWGFFLLCSHTHTVIYAFCGFMLYILASKHKKHRQIFFPHQLLHVCFFSCNHIFLCLFVRWKNSVFKLLRLAHRPINLEIIGLSL